MRIFIRLFGLLGVLVRHGLGHLFRRPRGIDGPTRLRLLLEDAGGTWLKFGQVLSLQPDVLPREYCNALFDLLDRVPPFDFAEVEKVFREELGRQPTEVPIAKLKAGGIVRPGGYDPEVPFVRVTNRRAAPAVDEQLP